MFGDLASSIVAAILIRITIRAVETIRAHLKLQVLAILFGIGTTAVVAIWVFYLGDTPLDVRPLEEW